MTATAHRSWNGWDCVWKARLERHCINFHRQHLPPLNLWEMQSRPALILNPTTQDFKLGFSWESYQTSTRKLPKGGPISLMIWWALLIKLAPPYGMRPESYLWMSTWPRCSNPKLPSVCIRKETSHIRQNDSSDSSNGVLPILWAPLSISYTRRTGQDKLRWSHLMLSKPADASAG